MKPLREAVQEYLSMRRALGFKLQKAGQALVDFVAFMEKHLPCAPSTGEFSRPS